jgi:putative transposase
MTSAKERVQVLELIAEAQQAGASLEACCSRLGLSARTIRRWQLARSTGFEEDGRAAAAANRFSPQKLTESEIENVVSICNSAEFRDMSPNQIVPILADRGCYVASESTFYRILKRRGLSARRGRASAPKRRAKPRWAARRPNEVWSWDITFLPSLVRGAFFKLYMILDVYSRKIVGWEVHLDESAEHAAKLMEQTVLREGVKRSEVTLHSDNGSPMKGSTMIEMLFRLGVRTSFSRARVSNDNPYSESLFRTLKYRPSWPSKPFADLTAARIWVAEFVRWYNTIHRHSGIRYTTPEERHEGRDREILREREKVYRRARKARPERWSKGIRNWKPIEVVELNPEGRSERPRSANRQRCRKCLKASAKATTASHAACSAEQGA